MKSTSIKSESYLNGRNELPTLLVPIPNLRKLISRMKQSHAWVRGEPEKTILYDSACKRIVLAALHEDTEVVSFQSNDNITFRVIEGQLRFHSKYRTALIEKDRFLTLHEKSEYSLSNDEETVFLMYTLK